MKSNYDVIVVGAGPAGSIAARTVARAGLDVLLIEKRQEIGDPVRCAEGTGKEGLAKFIDAGPGMDLRGSQERTYILSGRVLYGPY